MNALDLARRAALAGAAACVKARDAGSVEATLALSDSEGTLTALGHQLRACEAANEPSVARLRDELGVSQIVHWAVMCCAACERYPEVAAAFSLMAEDERVHLPTTRTLALLLHSVLGVAYSDVLLELAVGGPLDQLKLCERIPSGAQPLAATPLRLSSEENRALLRPSHAELTVNAPIQRIEPPPRIAMNDQGLDVLYRQLLASTSSVWVLRGPRRATRQLAIDLGCLTKQSVLFVNVDTTLPDLAELLRVRDGVLALDLTQFADSKPVPPTLLAQLGAARTKIMVLVPATAADLPADVVDVPPLSAATCTQIWSLAVNGEVDAQALAYRYPVAFDDAQRVSATARRRLEAAPGESFEEHLHEQMRLEGARRMGRTIVTLPPGPKLDALVVPTQLRASLEDLVVSYHARGHQGPMFERVRRNSMGKGIAALFSGAPGTGKTFAARCVGGELGLNVYRIDLSQTVSKYIGETEKALSRVFDEAEAGHGILLFDEADALFGKRSEVTDAHDRYANVEVAYLLQRMESFDGVSILTTNLRNNIDVAFIRRLRFVIEFPVPDLKARRQLWRMALPDPPFWHESVDVDAIAATFTLSGGDIHNAGIAATHLAAKAGELHMSHLVRATYRELEKVGLPHKREDFGKLAVHLPQEAR